MKAIGVMTFGGPEVLHVFELPDRQDFDGLIGLNFLHRFNYTVRSGEGRILVEEIAQPA